jgi:Phosphoribosylanthranilate isomerase
MSRSPLALKICGLTDPAQALAIAALGVDAIGVIGVPGSPRDLPERERRELFSALERHHPAVLRVWVVADLEDRAIAAGLSGPGRPTVVQLHGSETPERCLQLRRHHPTLQWWKALRIRHPADLDQLIRYADAVDGLLLDAWSPDQLGGTGHRLDLHWLDTLQTACQLACRGGWPAASAPNGFRNCANGCSPMASMPPVGWKRRLG